MKKDKSDFDDTKIFSDDLIDLVENDKDEMGTLLKKFVDGEPKNIDPLTEIPEPQMRLYGFSGAFKSAFFDTEEELIEYVKTHDTQFGSICVMDYLGTVANRSDVIRVTYKSGKQKLYTSVNEDGYGVYNNERSIYKGEYVWEYNHGSIREMYSAFRDRGIVFENDTYAKIDEYYRNIMAMCEERQIFTGSRKKSDKERCESTEEQNFDVLAVPCDRPFVVAPEKSEEFKNLKSSPESRQPIVEKYNINNLVKEASILKKIRKLGKKRK